MTGARAKVNLAANLDRIGKHREDHMRRSHYSKLALGVATLAAVAISGSLAFGADSNSAPNPYRLEDGWAKHEIGRAHV